MLLLPGPGTQHIPSKLRDAFFGCLEHRADGDFGKNRASHYVQIWNIS